MDTNRYPTTGIDAVQFPRAVNHMGPLLTWLACAERGLAYLRQPYPCEPPEEAYTRFESLAEAERVVEERRGELEELLANPGKYETYWREFEEELWWA